jgi:hypothetical protein
MNVRNWMFLTWNIRGLNESRKRESIRNFIISEKPNEMRLQESKLCNINGKNVKEVVGARLNCRACILANGSA